MLHFRDPDSRKHENEHENTKISIENTKMNTKIVGFQHSADAFTTGIPLRGTHIKSTNNTENSNQNGQK